MIRLTVWTIIVLLAGQPLAQAKQTDALNAAKAISSKATASGAKTFGELLQAIHGADADHFIKQLPQKVRDEKIIQFEVVENALAFYRGSKVDKLTFNSDRNSFSVNGALVTKEVLKSSIETRDPSLILKHLDQVGVMRPTLFSLILKFSKNEAHAMYYGFNPFGGNMPLMYQGFQSPWMCVQCQQYGTWAGSNWVFPQHWQYAYWGSMVGQMAAPRYSNLINATTSNPYGPNPYSSGVVQ